SAFEQDAVGRDIDVTAQPINKLIRVGTVPTARSATCGLLCEADERPRKLARLPPCVSDGDDATIWNLLVAQLEHRYARGKRTGDQLRDERDADARRDAGEFPRSSQRPRSGTAGGSHQGGAHAAARS